jgi:cytochrome oxidase assembly protein ShyY1
VSRDPAEFPEPGLHELVGVAEPAGRGLGQGMQRATSAAAGREVWTASALDLDSLAARDGRPFAGWVLRQLPGSGVPEWPKRSPPEPHDEGVHLGYAAQWFLFGAALLAVPFVVARLRRGRSTSDRPVHSA